MPPALVPVPRLGPGPRPLGVTILAVLSALFGAVAVLAGLMVATTGLFLDTIASQVAGPSEGSLVGLSGVIGVVFIAAGALEACVAYGLWKGKGWAWAAAVVLQVVGLGGDVLTLWLALRGPVRAFGLVFGLGSLLLNGFMVWYLWQPGVRRWFGQARPKASVPHGEPLFRLDSPGDLGAAAACLLLVAAGALLAFGTPLSDAGPALALVLFALAALSLLEAVSGATPLGKFLMVSLAGWASFLLAGGIWLELGTAPPPVGLPLAVLGGLAALIAAEALRKEAGTTHVALARRVIVLAQKPETHLAALKFLLPWAVIGIVAAFLLGFGTVIAGKYGSIFVQYFFNPVGKEFGLICGVTDCFGPALKVWEVAPFLVFIDAMTALFLAWNYGYMLRVPFVGHLLRWVEEHGSRAVEKRTWIRRLAFFGVLLYAAGPFEGTGAIGGTIVGRTIGLDAKRTWVAVVSGSIIRTTIFSLSIVVGIHAFGAFLALEPRWQAAILGLIAAALAGTAWVLLRRRRVQSEERDALSAFRPQG